MSAADKLYVLARADLPPGLQAAQAAHAAFELSLKHPAVVADWHERSAYLILLTVPDESTLDAWATVCAAEDVPHAVMVEPDLDGEHTAIAVAPSHLGASFSSLPLLGREVVMV